MTQHRQSSSSAALPSSAAGHGRPGGNRRLPPMPLTPDAALIKIGAAAFEQILLE